jgi:hypothetical protein
MSGKRFSTSAVLSFLEVSSGHFEFQDVPLPGAELGDPVQLVEPFQRPPGLAFLGYVVSPGVVRVSCRNKSDQKSISAPDMSMGITIQR